MFSVERIPPSQSAVKRMQYAYLEHLHLYPTSRERQPKTSLSFTEDMQKAQYPSSKEHDFLEKRQAFHEQEELLQQMNYTNGLHYSQLHNKQLWGDK